MGWKITVFQGEYGYGVGPSYSCHSASVSPENAYGQCQNAVSKALAKCWIMIPNQVSRDSRSSLCRATTLSRGLKAGTIWTNTWNQFDCAVPFGGALLCKINKSKLNESQLLLQHSLSLLYELPHRIDCILS